MSDPRKAHDAELAAWLDEELDAADAPDCEAMLAVVEAEIAHAEEKPGFWLRTRSTFTRRAIALAAALTVVAVFGLGLSDRDLGALDPRHLALSLGALGALLGLSLHQALRPLHRPPLAPWSRGAIAALTLGATFTLALLSPGATHGAALSTVSPCLFYGLFTALPVYLILRLLDRAKSAAPLLAACAAGLAGNLVLELHCPSEDPEHVMLGHFTVALLLVAGLALVHRITRR